ncbi:hypothetical protein [Kribbella sp. NPDC051620]|uniref:hypothetical protein n=1 Tax=Kribbella sp. NPDC051620 TaxID=3364120 RepID=UPI0037896EA4
MAASEELLMPIGHDLGALYAAPHGRRHQVRVGSDASRLTDDEFAVWLLAHGIDDTDRPTRNSLPDGGSRFGLSADRMTLLVERLLTKGLLATFHPDDESAIRFADRHQLVPLLTGLGPNPDQPWLADIGLLDQPVVQVSHAVYDVWMWTHLTPQLWSGCQEAAEIARSSAETTPDERDPHRLLAGILRSAHGLLAVRAAYFDRREAS